MKTEEIKELFKQFESIAYTVGTVPIVYGFSKQFALNFVSTSIFLIVEISV